jgi:hypothetical protein
MNLDLQSTTKSQSLDALLEFNRTNAKTLVDKIKALQPDEEILGSSNLLMSLQQLHEWIANNTHEVDLHYEILLCFFLII